MKLAIALALLAACADPPDGAPTIVRATPDFGPLVGGTTITLEGRQFAHGMRVLIGGRESPLVDAVDETELRLIVPPGEQPGDVELVVIGEQGTATEPHLFHYSKPPVIDAVAPADVVFDVATTTVTVTGAGFLSEASGDLAVLVDGALAADVVATSDTELTFTAPIGIALSRPTITVADLRGAASKQRGFRYTPSANPGLLLFSRFTTEIAQFYDPSTGALSLIPRTNGNNFNVTSVIRDDRGDYWGFDRSRRFGKLDFHTQTMIAPMPTTVLLPAMVRLGDVTYAIERISRRFGSFDTTSGVFTPIGTATITCCGSFGIAGFGSTIYVTTRSAGGVAITPIDPETGVLGTPVQLTGPSPWFHIEEMRFFHGTLYATNADSSLIAINPVTGETAIAISGTSRANAIELFE